MGKLFIAILMGVALMLILAIVFAKVEVKPIWSVAITSLAGGLIAFLSSRYFASPKGCKKSVSNL